MRWHTPLCFKIDACMGSLSIQNDFRTVFEVWREQRKLYYRKTLWPYNLRSLAWVAVEFWRVWGVMTTSIGSVFCGERIRNIQGYLQSSHNTNILEFLAFWAHVYQETVIENILRENRSDRLKIYFHCSCRRWTLLSRALLFLKILDVSHRCSERV